MWNLLSFCIGEQRNRNSAKEGNGQIIRELEPYDDPNLYDPKDKGILTEATMPLILIERANETEKRIQVENIAGMHASKEKKCRGWLPPIKPSRTFWRAPTNGKPCPNTRFSMSDIIHQEAMKH